MVQNIGDRNRLYIGFRVIKEEVYRSRPEIRRLNEWCWVEIPSIAETIYIRKNHHWMLYGFIFEWGVSIGKLVSQDKKIFINGLLSRGYPILYLGNLFLICPRLVLQSVSHILFLMKDINLKNICRNTGMAYSCRVLDMEEHLLDKGDYHLSYFSPDDFETLGNYQVFHNDSLEEYSYHKE